jgi:hypothetical protein
MQFYLTMSDVTPTSADVGLVHSTEYRISIGASILTIPIWMFLLPLSIPIA